jgi:hypothetical protein
MPVYILDMLELPAEIKSAFEKGEFSIRQTSGSFNGIWSDMGTEKTIIKDSKGSGHQMCRPFTLPFCSYI